MRIPLKNFSSDEANCRIRLTLTWHAVMAHTQTIQPVLIHEVSVSAAFSNACLIYGEGFLGYVRDISPPIHHLLFSRVTTVTGCVFKSKPSSFLKPE